VIAMKLAGTVSDATAIRAQMDKAFRGLPKDANPNAVDGVNDVGGVLANTTVAVVENGKIKGVQLRSIASGK
jgi:branched-chain amino acid transport system substrate-binding protein